MNYRYDTALRRMIDSVTVLRGFRRPQQRLRYSAYLIRRLLVGPTPDHIRRTRSIGGLYQYRRFLFDLRPDAVDGSEVHPAYERQTHRWLDTVITRSSDIFLDVGAHCGVYAVPYSEYFRHTFAFEPHPGSFTALLRNVRLNKLSRRITCVRAAVSNYTGRGKLSIAESETNSTLCAAGTPGALDVDVVTIDDFLAAASLDGSRVGLIKLDIEGAELTALQGSLQTIATSRPRIVIEANTETAHRQTVTMMTQLGYRRGRVADGVNLCFSPD
jgi:FkbM family methyltransferase